MKFINQKLIQKEFKIIGNLDHVRLFPDNYSAGLLPNIASAVVTGSGSVGIEYPCYGIPCILANSSHYLVTVLL